MTTSGKTQRFGPARLGAALFALAILLACLAGAALGGGLGLLAWFSPRPVPPAPANQVALPVYPTLAPSPTFTRLPSTDTATPAPDPIEPTLTLIAATLFPPPIFEAGGSDAWCVPWNARSEQGRVVEVIDAVTLQVEIGGQFRLVRYIGAGMLDYSSDPSIWVRSTEANRQLVEGQTVLLYADQQETDEEGRLLRYVIAGARFVNYELIAAGYANLLSMPPNTRCDALLTEAESRALQGQVGLWQPTPTVTRTLIPLPTGTVSNLGRMVITFLVNRGTLWEEPEEFVEFKNDSDFPIQLENWTLQDEQGHIFTFPRFVLGSQKFCRVYTNLYRPRSCGFTFNSPSPIWSNDRECAYLKDPLGNLVSTFCYPP
jgi:endonuclease YncB( thermonuclease family)